VRRSYDNGEAWGFDSHSYAPSLDLLSHATAFVEHTTGYAWSACIVRKNAKTMVTAAKALQQHVFTTLGKAVRYLWTDSDPITLSKEFTKYLATEGIRLGVSPPYCWFAQGKSNSSSEPIPLYHPLLRQSGLHMVLAAYCG
jgi:hypothetical protein